MELWAHPVLVLLLACFNAALQIFPHVYEPLDHVLEMVMLVAGFLLELQEHKSNLYWLKVMKKAVNVHETGCSLAKIHISLWFYGATPEEIKSLLQTLSNQILACCLINIFLFISSLGCWKRLMTCTKNFGRKLRKDKHEPIGSVDTPRILSDHQLALYNDTAMRYEINRKWRTDLSRRRPRPQYSLQIVEVTEPFPTEFNKLAVCSDYEVTLPDSTTDEDSPRLVRILVQHAVGCREERQELVREERQELVLKASDGNNKRAEAGGKRKRPRKDELEHED